MGERRINPLFNVHEEYKRVIINPYRYAGGGGGNGLLTGLTSYWDLDETSGTRYDSHGSFDMTDNNTVGYSSSGINGNASSHVKANSEYFSSLIGTWGGGPVSLSWWCKDPASGWATSNAMLNIGGTNSAYVIGLSSSNWRFKLGPNFKSLNPATYMSGSTWHHCAMTNDGTTLKVFINGVCRGYVSTTAYASGTNTNFLIGYQSSSRIWDDELDEFAFWDGVTLSDGGVTAEGQTAGGQIATLYNSGTGTFYADFTT